VFVFEPEHFALGGLVLIILQIIRERTSMLLHIPQVLSAQDLREARVLLDKAPWEDGRRTAGHRAQGVKTNEQIPLDSPEAQQLGALIGDRLMRHPSFLSAALPCAACRPASTAIGARGPMATMSTMRSSPCRAVL
jgi:hypothetical protein